MSALTTILLRRPCHCPGFLSIGARELEHSEYMSEFSSGRTLSIEHGMGNPNRVATRICRGSTRGDGVLKRGDGQPRIDVDSAEFIM